VPTPAGGFEQVVAGTTISGDTHNSYVMFSPNISSNRYKCSKEKTQSKNCLKYLNISNYRVVLYATYNIDIYTHIVVILLTICSVEIFILCSTDLEILVYH